MGCISCCDSDHSPSQKSYFLINSKDPDSKIFFRYAYHLKIKGIYEVYLNFKLESDFLYRARSQRITNQFIFKMVIVHSLKQNRLILNDENEILFKLIHNWKEYGQQDTLVEDKIDSNLKNPLLEEFVEILSLIQKDSRYILKELAKHRDQKSTIGRKSTSLKLPRSNIYVEEYNPEYKTSIRGTELKFQYENVNPVKSKYNIYRNVKFDENYMYMGMISKSFTFRTMLLNTVTSDFILFNDDDEKILVITPWGFVNLKETEWWNISEFKEAIDQIVFGPDSLLAKKTREGFKVTSSIKFSLDNASTYRSIE